MSWGTNFVLVLDGDKPGEDSKERYINEFDGFVNKKIFTLKDVFKVAKVTEDIIDDSDKKVLVDTAFGEGSFDHIKGNANQVKTKLNFAIMQLLINKKEAQVSQTTKDNFKTLFKFLQDVRNNNDDNSVHC